MGYINSQNWSNVTGNNQKFLTFNNTSGLKVDVSANATIWDCLCLFLTNDIIELIVLETNRNAYQYLSKVRVTQSSRFSQWVSTDEKKIKLFIGLLIWMGLVKMPNISDYWSIKLKYKNKVAPKTITSNRFLLFLRFRHFSDNENAPEGDRIYKIRNLDDKVVHNFQNVMEPREYIAVDGSVSWSIII